MPYVFLLVLGWLQLSGGWLATRGRRLAMVARANEGGVYVLQLERGRYYVGKTGRTVELRIQEHFSSPKPAWIRAHRPIAAVTPLTFLPTDLESWERAETLERIWVHGAARVRGWQYTRFNLSSAEKSQIVLELCERKNLCRKCGNAGHMYSNCQKKFTRAKWLSSIFQEGYSPPVQVKEVLVSNLSTTSVTAGLPLAVGTTAEQSSRNWSTVLRVVCRSDALKFQFLTSLR